jgi:hypothetical protein
VFNAVPPSFHAHVHELRTLIDLLLVAHEAAAYVVGFEAGRLDERTHR